VAARGLGSVGGRILRLRGGGLVNLLFPLPDGGAAECVDTLLARPGLRLERIVSYGQASPPGFW